MRAEARAKTEGATGNPWKNNTLEQRLHRPFFLGGRGPRGRKASLKLSMDSASIAEGYRFESCREYLQHKDLRQIDLDPNNMKTDPNQ